MDAEARIASVKTNETRNGNTRWTVVDDSGTEYTTFRPAIGTAAEQAEGKLARISSTRRSATAFATSTSTASSPSSASSRHPAGR